MKLASLKKTKQGGGGEKGLAKKTFFQSKETKLST